MDYCLIEGSPRNNPCVARTASRDIADDQGLPQFLAQWLDQPGIPVLDVRWRNESADDKTKAIVSIFQMQPGVPYTLHIDLKLRTRKGVLMRAVDVQGIESRVEFEVPDELVGVESDPSRKLLIWRPEYGAPPVSTH